MTPLKLNARERLALDRILTCAPDSRTLKRAYALNRVAQGESILEIAAELDVSRQSIYNWIEHFQTRTDQSLALRLTDAPRSGRPKTVAGVIDPLIDAIIDGDPRESGYGSTIWTARLLVHYLADQHAIEVSLPSVRLAIDRLRIRWKRPRHSLALRPAHWRQAKGG